MPSLGYTENDIDTDTTDATGLTAGTAVAAWPPNRSTSPSTAPPFRWRPAHPLPGRADINTTLGAAALSKPSTTAPAKLGSGPRPSARPPHHRRRRRRPLRRSLCGHPPDTAGRGQNRRSARQRHQRPRLADRQGQGVERRRKLRIDNLSTESLSLVGASATAVNGGQGPATATPSAATRSARTDHAIHELRKQLDRLTEDSDYNGVKLLKADKLKLTFNENAAVGLDLQARIPPALFALSRRKRPPSISVRHTPQSSSTMPCSRPATRPSAEP